MNPEKSAYLVKHFPNLYKDYGGDPKQTLMAFGFEVGDGWFDLIKELSEKLEPMGVVAMQVKEKFGGLRFYVTHATDAAWDLIEEAERKSETICEECGDPGEIRDDRHWVLTLCDKCNEGNKAPVV
jgi:hypothetical protein